MTSPSPTSTLRFRVTALGAVLLVCGFVLAVLGFSGTGAFLGVVGLVIGFCGAVAVAAGLTRKGVR